MEYTLPQVVYSVWVSFAVLSEKPALTCVHSAALKFQAHSCSRLSLAVEEPLKVSPMLVISSALLASSTVNLHCSEA